MTIVDMDDLITGIGHLPITSQNLKKTICEIIDAERHGPRVIIPIGQLHLENAPC